MQGEVLHANIFRRRRTRAAISQSIFSKFGDIWVSATIVDVMDFLVPLPQSARPFFALRTEKKHADQEILMGRSKNLRT